MDLAIFRSKMTEWILIAQVFFRPVLELGCNERRLGGGEAILERQTCLLPQSEFGDDSNIWVVCEIVMPRQVWSWRKTLSKPAKLVITRSGWFACALLLEEPCRYLGSRAHTERATLGTPPNAATIHEQVG